MIIPTYFSSGSLKRALHSVASQTLPVAEIIVIDDSGDYGEVIKIKNILKDFTYPRERVKFYFNNKNMGPSYTRNRGIEESASKYIAFLDSDDIWHPVKIEVQYSIMEELRSKLSGHQFNHTSNGNLDGVSKIIKTRVIKRKELLLRNPFSTPTVMAVREDFTKFPEDIRFGEDYFCWIANYSPGDFIFIKSTLAGGFKASYGASGLSQDISVMSQGVKTAFLLLLKRGHISKYEYFTALAIETMKYLNRKTVIFLRQFRG
ncbi:glycosyltransferase family A protein [Deinococcus sp. RIT780]|uniref:glycosyltransferase family 2 protein n=1 Tax=Deinococcus sp. RIT780 TaxID=2870472 RepID=UPI001C89C77C|nr:glycosyltransferase family 2 protein [Deinococcus sp. RIT780]